MQTIFKNRVLGVQGGLGTAAIMDVLTVSTGGGRTETGYKYWMGIIPKFASKLRTWGEAGVVKGLTKSMLKTSDRVVTYIIVGYNTNSGDNIYRMWNPDTNKIHNTCDIIWLKRDILST